MKRLPLLLVTVLLVVFPLWGANSKLLAPGLYQVTSLKGGNVLFYVGSSGVAVVDSGTAPATARADHAVAQVEEVLLDLLHLPGGDAGGVVSVWFMTRPPLPLGKSESAVRVR